MILVTDMGKFDEVVVLRRQFFSEPYRGDTASSISAPSILPAVSPGTIVEGSAWTRSAVGFAGRDELAGWTKDRLVADRLDRLPRSRSVHGRPNANIIMATFLHPAPEGMRFNGPVLGASSMLQRK